MKRKETKTVMNIITNFTAKGAQVIYGSAYDDSMGDSMRVTVVATGLDGGKDKEVAPLEKPDEKRDVWEHNNRSYAEPQQADPWTSRQSVAQQPAAPKVAQPQVESKPTVAKPEPQPSTPAAQQPAQSEPQQPQEPEKQEEKAADEWETGWWSIRHDNK